MLCAFFVPMRSPFDQIATDRDGRCKRFPPSVVYTPRGMLFVQPLVNHSDTCGEFCPIDEPKGVLSEREETR